MPDDLPKLPLDSLPLDVLKHIASFLEADEVKSHFFLSGSKALHRAAMPTLRLRRAAELHHAIMQSDYNKIEKHACTAPDMLFVKYYYKPNRWTTDEEYPPRRLSALEYAWLMGDKILTELFERAIEKKWGNQYLDQHKDRKEKLTAMSMKFRQVFYDALVTCFDNYEPGELKTLIRSRRPRTPTIIDSLVSKEVEALWRIAPTWVYHVRGYISEVLDMKLLSDIHGIFESQDIESEIFSVFRQNPNIPYGGRNIQGRPTLFGKYVGEPPPLFREGYYAPSYMDDLFCVKALAEYLIFPLRPDNHQPLIEMPNKPAPACNVM